MSSEEADRRGQEILEAADDLELEEGDIVSVISSLSEHEKIKEEIGEEILDPELLSYDVTTKETAVLTAATSLSGQFANLDTTQAPLGGGLAWQVNYNALNVQLEVVSASVSAVQSSLRQSLICCRTSGS